jgi:hypothetical protein
VFIKPHLEHKKKRFQNTIQFDLPTYLYIMKTTIVLTPKQADMLLNNLPQGHKIKLSVADANKIIDSVKTKQK